MFTLPAGEYSENALTRENLTGRLGRSRRNSSFPIWVSSLPTCAPAPWCRVVEQPAEPLSSAVRSAECSRRFSNHPLGTGRSEGGAEQHQGVPQGPEPVRVSRGLRPSVSKDSKSPSIMASLSFYQGKTRAFQTEAVRVKVLNESRAVPTAQVQFEIPLEPRAGTLLLPGESGR